jgi:hypothetical protein
MTKRKAILTGIAVGAALMYVFNPRIAGRRLAVGRDKAIRLAKRSGRLVGGVSKDISKGAVGAARKLTGNREPRENVQRAM